MPLRSRTFRENQRRQIQRERLDTDRRRRELQRRYPDVEPRQLARLGEGLQGGAGIRSLRAWLESLEELTDRLV